MCDGDYAMTLAKACHVVSKNKVAKELSVLMVELQESNTRGSSVCHDDGATNNKNIVKRVALGKAMEVLINARRCTK